MPAVDRRRDAREPARARPPEPALDALLRARLGPVHSLEHIGSTSGTYLVRTTRRLAVAKHMPASRLPAAVAALLARAASSKVAAPALLDVIELGGDAGWFALFEHVAGAVPVPATAAWERAWHDAFVMLPRLHALRSDAPTWRSDARWLAAAPDSGDAAVRALHDELLAAADGEPLTLAHGDFAPQNFICGARGLVLVDWEEVGYARAGYDAGWLLCLNRVGAGPRLNQRALHGRLLAMGFDMESLRWGEGVGLLRMHRRATGWVSTRGAVYTALRDRVRAHIVAYLCEGGHAHARRRDLR